MRERDGWRDGAPGALFRPRSLKLFSAAEKEMKYPPQFLEKLQNMGIPEGTPVRLECRVLGMPPPVIFWKKDNDSVPKTKDRIT